MARIDLTPAAVPEHDDFRTAVTLDGSRSSDPLDDPDGEVPLSFAWELAGDELRIDSGDTGSPTLVVRFRGDSPPTVRLTVTDADGASSTAERQLQLTISR